jgi:hypothetical protein
VHGQIVLGGIIGGALSLVTEPALVTAIPAEEEKMMADDKTKRGGGDRSRVAAGEGYEVRYFARKHGISKDQAEELIKKIGNNREKLNEAAGKLKKAG